MLMEYRSLFENAKRFKETYWKCDRGAASTDNDWSVRFYLPPAINSQTLKWQVQRDYYEGGLQI